MKEKDVVNGLIFMAALAVVGSVVLLKRDKVGKKLNQLMKEKLQSKLKGISQDAIAKRAYEIFTSGIGGSKEEHWHRAERELQKR